MEGQLPGRQVIKSQAEFGMERLFGLKVMNRGSVPGGLVYIANLNSDYFAFG